MFRVFSRLCLVELSNLILVGIVFFINSIAIYCLVDCCIFICFELDDMGCSMVPMVSSLRISLGVFMVYGFELKVIYIVFSNKLYIDFRENGNIWL